MDDITKNNATGGITGKGFVKGDPRCHRGGRPRIFDVARDVALEIANRKVKTKKGERKIVQRILEGWANSRSWQAQKAFMEYAYGKVPDETKLTGLIGTPATLAEFIKMIDEDGK